MKKIPYPCKRRTGTGEKTPAPPRAYSLGSAGRKRNDLHSFCPAKPAVLCLPDADTAGQKLFTPSARSRRRVYKEL